MTDFKEGGFFALTDPRAALKSSILNRVNFAFSMLLNLVKFFIVQKQPPEVFYKKVSFKIFLTTLLSIEFCDIFQKNFLTQSAFRCSKLTTETLEQRVKYIQS